MKGLVTGLLAFAALASVSHNASAVYKCVDAAGKVAYQAAPCDTGHQQIDTGIQNNPSPVSGPVKPTDKATGLTSKVKLSDVVIVQQFVKEGAAVYVTMRPRWVNGNASKVTVYYKVQMLDYSNFELNAYTKFKDLDSLSTSTAPNSLDVILIGKPGGFDYKKAVKARITYAVKGDESEVAVDNVRVVKEGF